jgi:hypothetical protein
MKILDALHALILSDQKKLISRRTILTSASGDNFKFIRVDTKLNWPRLIVQDRGGKEFVFNSKEVSSFNFTAKEPDLLIEDFIDPA